MRALRMIRALCLALALPAGGPALSQTVDRMPVHKVTDIAGHVAEASQRFGVPEHWIHAIIRVESAGRIGAVSSAGAMGLMQLMPGTWARQRARFALGRDPFDPRDNILAGTSYLREMYDLYGAAGFLAAYNAGPGRYEDFRDRGRPLPPETRAYVARIAPMLQSGSAPGAARDTSRVQSGRASWTDSQLFAARPAAAAPEPERTDQSISGEARDTPPSPPHGLFAPVSGRGPE